MKHASTPSDVYLAFIEQHSRLLLGLALILCTLLHLPLAELPLGRDQGIWSSIGLALLDGDIFFKDITHFNLPGLGFAYATAFIFTNNPSTATMLLSLSSSLLTILGLYYLLKETINTQAACIAALLWALLWPSYLNFWLISQKDVLAIPGLLFSAFFLARSYSAATNRPLLLCYLSGVCAAICMVFKPVFIIYAFLLAAVVSILWWKQDTAIRHLLYRGAALIAGGLSIGLPLIAYIVLNGALDKAIFGLLEFAPWYSLENHQAAWFIALKLLARSYFVEFHYPVYAWWSLAAWSPLLILSLIAYQKIQAPRKQWLLLPSLGALLVYFIQNKGFGYHAAPWQACLLLFIACAIYWVIAQHNAWQQSGFLKRHASHIVIALVVLQLLRAFTVSHYSQHYVASYLGFMRHEDMLKAFKVDKLTAHPLVSEQVAEWIKEHSQTSDRIVIWGQENQIYSMSNRRHATEHTFDFPLSALVKQESHPKLFERQQQLRTQYIADLKRTQPLFFIVVSHDSNPVEPEPSNEVLHRVPGLELLLAQDYRLIKTIERFEIYQRIEH